ncbi:MAG: tRNA (N6-isopentenyl adenosine(37)-C2)-methylthiotransferase MiaB [Candidatus Terrybacteria bacterium RIFCSPLOWO2_02_42_20]|uniref:tRNA-2-methylthio-N(6)-dimethylallyladenosine synthase n=2 Tax=Candidatus Terryibacteriota TaxID=1817920 RepID=A0A1G2PRY5_9BACT|nr:MAG: tRNA (N6-isopentenyl adenosine(37)-C2)-methylthiotransferase MiaB [Candidatus Terrybacteria bacterium RIFCSPHIGHO2_02_41_19]OHA53503.1 MAG: tRNA (N6-isopentenyl adenosine(37)-C2)-methylthiotransferase MiaB [Candidatus Terrybacteria bacterium RIFCSPLOWO2_02_42_20]
MGKYLITTFGCQSNEADSEKTAEVMENLGYAHAENMEDLISAKNPVLIFNTCSVRQKAEDRVFGLNKKTEQFKIKNSKLKIVLTGCMMHYSEKDLKKRLPLFDYFIDIKNIITLEKILPKIKISENKDLLTEKTDSKISALIPISHGCDNFCTYCIVPLARGREISRGVLDIMSDVKKAVDDGAKEIWLLGQTVNSYRCNLKSKISNLKSKEIKFLELLRMVNDIPGDFWIRFTSPHPKYFSDELIKAMAECDKFAHYINLPIQSGNNAVLKRMGRPYTVGHYKKLVGKIRKAMPDIAISTDIIVGFPGETRKQFEDTKKLFEEIKFDMAFISEYSPRPKTVAYKMFKDNVSHQEKESRKNELNEILKKTALENNQKLVGKTVKVLNGRTEGNKPIEITNVKHSMLNIKNNFVSAKIIKASIWSLKGKLI